MVAAAAFMVLLDAVILSATPDTTRLAFALVVTIVVVYAILKIWRSNSAIERAAGRETVGGKVVALSRSSRTAASWR